MYQTILVQMSEDRMVITFNRPNAQNSINMDFVAELNQAFELAENMESVRFIVLQGQKGIFCTGMDFSLYLEQDGEVSKEESSLFTKEYMLFLKRIAQFPKAVIALIDGKVMAGGVGIAAACDLVIATPGTTFSLSEALWGLLPSMVLPYLIRRIGFQPAYRMTLTAKTLEAEEARQLNLIDELTKDLDRSLEQTANRLKRVSSRTTGLMKQYFKKLWLIDDEMEWLGVEQTSTLSSDREVIQNIKNFLEYKIFPWESKNP